ncbi:uncharacterized protein LOC133361432 isoform X2 [Lethenteron reissneri]|uniref:uncharacterized protein LOC133361432 isoform X2 n=1 Tax=Lethenteron reissneri TaxID=7753 RepID=UPI002AB5ECA3|nr:uncharacterized protein LOC133361432 isoform X2 [Lethenteron reissneri]
MHGCRHRNVMACYTPCIVGGERLVWIPAHGHRQWRAEASEAAARWASSTSTQPEGGCLRLPAPCDGSSRACCVLARRGWARWRSRWSSCGRGTAALTLAECSNTVGWHQRDTLDNAAKAVAPLARLVERLATPQGVVVKIPLGGRISHNTGRGLQDGSWFVIPISSAVAGWRC